MHGDLIDWENANWNITNMDSYTLEYSEICKPLSLGLQIIPGAWNFTVGRTLCKNMRGYMNVITTAENQAKVFAMKNEGYDGYFIIAFYYFISEKLRHFSFKF